jgi:hypothetical protein
MSQKLARSAAELESMIMAEVREHPECDRAAVVIRPMGLSWDAVLIGDEPPEVECKARLDEITNRLRHEFELAEQFRTRLLGPFVGGLYTSHTQPARWGFFFLADVNRIALARLRQKTGAS